MWGEILKAIVSAVLPAAVSYGFSQLTPAPKAPTINIGGPGGAFGGPPPPGSAAGGGSAARPSGALNFGGGTVGGNAGQQVGGPGSTGTKSPGFVVPNDLTKLLGSQQRGFGGI
jgi:hypothetical protein